MNNEILRIIWDYTAFLDKVFSLLERDKIDVSNYELDHICYRVETEERYEGIKKIFLEESELLSEIIIGGRMISTFKLKVPLLYHNREMTVIEIPAPKGNSAYSEGLEHIEFVIDKSFEDFKQMYPDIKFKTDAESKDINPDTQIKYKNCSVKFHHNTLEYVIKYLE